MFCFVSICICDEQPLFYFVFPQLMVVTHSGPIGLSVPSHVGREVEVALVHAPIPLQQMADETAVDWDKLQNCKHVTHATAQVKIVLTIFITIKPLM